MPYPLAPANPRSVRGGTTKVSLALPFWLRPFHNPTQEEDSDVIAT